MPPINLYYFAPSPPCQIVRLVARHIGIDLNLKEVSIVKQEHLSPEFININPEHTIPTLVDGDVILWESRVIISYLASKYDKSGKFYPEDVKTRATINRFLFFDAGTLYKRFTDYVFPVMFGEGVKPDPEKLEKIFEALGFLEASLGTNTFAVGSEVTIADHALFVTVSAMSVCGIDIGKFKKVDKWLKACEDVIPDYEELSRDPTKNAFGEMLKAKLAKLK